MLCRRSHPQADFLACTETPIRPLIDDLEFIENKQRWGYRFRFGLFTIGDSDFARIRAAMTGTPVGVPTIEETL